MISTPKESSKNYKNLNGNKKKKSNSNYISLPLRKKKERKKKNTDRLNFKNRKTGKKLERKKLSLRWIYLDRRNKH